MIWNAFQVRTVFLIGRSVAAKIHAFVFFFRAQSSCEPKIQKLFDRSRGQKAIVKVTWPLRFTQPHQIKAERTPICSSVGRVNVI